MARKRRCLADVHSVLKDFEKYRPKVELGVDRLEQIGMVVCSDSRNLVPITEVCLSVSCSHSALGIKFIDMHPQVRDLVTCHKVANLLLSQLKGRYV